MLLPGVGVRPGASSHAYCNLHRYDTHTLSEREPPVSRDRDAKTRGYSGMGHKPGISRIYSDAGRASAELAGTSDVASCRATLAYSQPAEASLSPNGNKKYYNAHLPLPAGPRLHLLAKHLLPPRASHPQQGPLSSRPPPMIVCMSIELKL